MTWSQALRFLPDPRQILDSLRGPPLDTGFELLICGPSARKKAEKGWRGPRDRKVTSGVWRGEGPPLGKFPGIKYTEKEDKKRGEALVSR